MGAVDDLVNLLAEDEHHDHYFLLGELYELERKHSFAITNLEKALELGHTHNPRLYRHLAVSYAKMGRHQDAVNTWAQYFELKGDTVSGNNCFDYGNQLRLIGESELATKYLKMSNQIWGNPDYPDIWDLYIKRELWDTAAEILEEELVTNPNNVIALAKLADSYFFCFEYEKSIEVYTKLISLESSSDNLAMFARVYENTGQFDLASQLWEQINIEELDQKNAQVYRKAYILGQVGRYEEACKLFHEQGKNINYKRSKSKRLLVPETKYYELATQAVEENNFELAEQLYEKAIWNVEQFTPKLYVELGDAQLAQGKYEAAFESYTRQRIFRHNYGMSRRPLKRKNFNLNTKFAELYDVLPVREDLIYYCSYNGSNFSGSPYALFKELYKRQNTTHIIAINNEGEYPHHVAELDNVHIVKYDSYPHLIALASAKRIVINTSLPFYFSSKPEQLILNTWHGTPLKTLGYEVETRPYHSSRNVQKSLRMATHFINPNQFTQDVMTRSYTLHQTIQNQIEVTGYPRQDLMLNCSEERKLEIKKILDIPVDKKVVLYAPTYRGDGNKSNGKSHPQMEKAIKLMKKDAEQYHMLYKGHYFEKSTDPRLSKIDTNELLSIVDVLITDYSSIGIDFLAMNKPIIYYTFDLEEYKAERGMYIEIEELTDFMANTPEELVSLVNKQVTAPKITSKQSAAKNLYCPLDDGNATKRVLDFLEATPQEIVEDKKEVLIYSGNFFLMNGISRAFTNLISKFDKDKYRINILLQEGLVNTEEPIEILDELYKAGYTITIKYYAEVLTLRENYAKNKYNQNNYFYNERHKKIFLEGQKRNAIRLFGHKQFDAIINYESGYTPFMNSLLVATDAKKKVFVLHNDMAGEANLKYPYLHKTFALYDEYDHLLSVSDACSDVNYECIGVPYNISKEKFGTLNNVIDYKSIKENAELDFEEEFEEDSKYFEGDSKVLITIGRLSPEKNQELAIRSFRKVLDNSQDKNIKLLIMGGGPLETDLNNLIKNLELQDNVFMLGIRSNPFAYLKQADCFIFPSLHEGQGLVLLESLIVDTPIITTDIPTSVEIVDKYGGVYTPSTVEAFSSAIEDYLAGKLTFRNDYDPSAYNHHIMDVIYDAIN